MLEYVAILAFATAVVELIATCLKFYLDFRELAKTDKDVSSNHQKCDCKSCSSRSS